MRFIGGEVQAHQSILKVFEELKKLLNGNVEFGSPTYVGNVRGTWVEVTAPATPNTDFTVTHALGILPAGFDVKKKDVACDVYLGSVAATTTQLTLRATAANAVLTLFVH